MTDYRPITARIIEIVAEVTECPRHLIYSPTKDADVVYARFFAYHLIREHTQFSYPRIGRVLERDHSTIMHGQRRFSEWMKADNETRGLYQQAQRRVAELETI
jgi:chromosomal replication initiation ATPase DnaA